VTYRSTLARLAQSRPTRPAATGRPRASTSSRRLPISALVLVGVGAVGASLGAAEAQHAGPVPSLTASAEAPAGGSRPDAGTAVDLTPEGGAQEGARGEQRSSVQPADGVERAAAQERAAVALSRSAERRQLADQVRAQVADQHRVRAEAAAAEEAAVAAAAAEAAAAAARADTRSAGRELAAQRGWTGGQFSCLERLWTKESGWKHTADNPTSSAYGIPQALPGKKMASAGEDWETNPLTQITWGLGYIEQVYGTPCAAWAHSRATNWY